MKKHLHTIQLAALLLAVSSTAFGAKAFFRELSSKSEQYRHHAKERYIQGEDGNEDRWENDNRAPLAFENVQHGVKAVATGTDGSVYVVGAHKGIVGVQKSTLEPLAGSKGFGTVNYNDGYLAKLAPDGTWAWSKTLSQALKAFLGEKNAERPLFPRKIRVAGSAIYIAGDCDKRDDKYGDAFKRSFVAKLDLDGVGQWCTFFREKAKKTGTNDQPFYDPQVHISDIAVSREGEVVFAGDFSCYLNIYNHNGFNENYWDDKSNSSWLAEEDWRKEHDGKMSWPTGTRSYYHRRVLDCFAGKLRGSDGTPIWWTKWGFREDDIVTAVTGDSEGNVYVGWVVANDIEHSRDPRHLFSSFGDTIGQEDGVAFIAKLDKDGARNGLTELFRWDTDGRFTDLVFANNYLYAIGSWRGYIHSQNGDASDYDARRNSTGQSGYWRNNKMDSFVWRLSPNLWRRKLFFFTGRNEIWADDLDVDANGDLHVVGRFSTGTMKGGNTELSTAMDWTFFRARLGWDLDIKSLTQFEGVGVDYAYGASVAVLPDDKGIVVGGAFDGKTDTSKLCFGSGATRSELVFGGTGSIYKGFITLFDKQDNPYQQVGVTLASDETLRDGELGPYEGTRNFLKRGDLELDVKCPKYLYYNNGNSRVDSESDAVRRFRCDGFSSQPSVTAKPGSPVNELSFTPTEDTKVTATWTEEFRATVRSTDDDLGNDAGAPALNVSGAWQEKGARVSATVDEYYTPDPSVATRYRCRGYKVTIGATVATVQFDFDTVFDDEKESANRKSTDTYELTGPLTIEFLWEKQHRLSIATNSSDVDAGPRTTVQGETFEGTGVVWLKHGASMDLSAEIVTLDDGTPMAPQERVGEGSVPTPDPQNGDAVANVTINEPSAVTWKYDFDLYYGTCMVTDPIPLEDILDGKDGRPSYEDVDRSRQPLVFIAGGNAPVGSTNGNMTLWGGPEGRKQLVTVRPGTIRVEWFRTDGKNARILTQITVEGPSAPEDYRYRHVAGTAPVNLEPSYTDHRQFVSLQYTTCGGRAPNSRYEAPRAGYSVLIFTVSPEDGPAATGDITKEEISGWIVKTSEYDSGTADTGSAVVGQEIHSADHDSSLLENGYILNPLTRYNTLLHDRPSHTGPIFPVNDGGDEFVVVWYEVVDGIAWPYKPVHYNVTWPDPDDMGVIFVASRMGSECKDRFGNDQIWPDANGENRNYLDPQRYTELAVYFQNDRNKAGYNPNEEHAILLHSYRHQDMPVTPSAVFALRNDLNITSGDDYTSPNAVLLQYYDGVDKVFRMQLFHVVPDFPAQGYQFQYGMKAGEPVVPPYPLNEVIGARFCDETKISNPDHDNDGVPDQRCAWRDSRGQHWAVSADHLSDGNGGTYDPYIDAKFYYPLDPSFWYDKDDDGDGQVQRAGDPVAWKCVFNAGNGTAEQVDVRYTLSWPDNAPVLKVGETAMFSGGEYATDQSNSDLGLPDVLKWACGRIVYDSLNPTMDPNLVFTRYLMRLIRPLDPVKVELAQGDIPKEIKMTMGSGGTMSFDDLNAGLKDRFLYDFLNKQLVFRGLLNGKSVDDPQVLDRPLEVSILQPNAMTYQEYQTLLDLDENRDEVAWQDAVARLRSLGRNPERFDESSIPNNYTAGLSPHARLDGTLADDQGEPALVWGPGAALVCNPALLKPNYWDADEGYVTILENDDESLGNLPVTPHIFKVRKDQRVRGSIRMMEPANVFDEKVTLRLTTDFGGNPDELVFQWWYRQDDGSTQPTPDQAPAGSWKLFPDISGNNGLGMSEISLAGAAKVLLVDNWFYCRWRHNRETEWSDWAGSPASNPDDYQAQLAYGWIKRVLDKINPYDARISDFGNNAPATYTSMIRQAGHRYEGPIALNPDPNVIEDYGLIEIYKTVLKRARELSIDLSQPETSSGVDSALLLVSSRIAKLYMLLGNEAYSDAMDPTIGFGEDSTEYGSMAPTIFCFQNQLSNLLEEELCLLRGQARTGAAPAYNRLLWNFTNGDGEAAYALSYNMSDVNHDGFINEEDGAILYPQGHGDAWGHYLTAQKAYYNLLRHPHFNWEARSESYSIGDVPITVDYYDERQFAEIAAAKAKTGAEIVDLEYRSHYVEDPNGQWQGYTDTDEGRAWGVTGWARRAGQGALFDWAVANAIVPSEDTNPDHTGVTKIDRSTVPEIAEISAEAAKIRQKTADADTGLNPLGLSTDVVPMDIDPVRVDPTSVNPATHFEQIYERARKAVDNARRIFNYTNKINNMLRQVANTTEDFSRTVLERDRDFRNRLIEIFGSPYEGVIGPGKTYPMGYQGPDIFLYMYVDVSEVSGKTVPEPSASFKAFFKPFRNHVLEAPKSSEVDVSFSEFINGNRPDFKAKTLQFFDSDLEDPATGGSYSSVLEVDFPQGAGAFSFQAPSSWGGRRSPGEIQQAISELIQAEAHVKEGVARYNVLMKDIQGKLNVLKARSNLAAATVEIENLEYKAAGRFTSIAAVSKGVGQGLMAYANTSESALRGIAEMLPTSVGLSNDVTSSARGSIKLMGSSVASTLKVMGVALQINGGMFESLAARVHQNAKRKIVMREYEYEVQQQLADIQTKLVEEGALRMELFRRRERMRQAMNSLKATLQKGVRLMEERKAFNQKVSGVTQKHRYQDMAFRIFRNDALQKYRAAFDLAARYVYLAAKAYDYETNLDADDPASAQPVLTEIVKQRTLGQFIDGEPVLGRGGLGDILATLKVNFDVLKGQMGFNNPQVETGRFSLRTELFRIKSASTGAGGDKLAQANRLWERTLEKARVDNLWDVTEFRRFCRPFAAEDIGAQPGLVIEFGTEIISGKNFFGRPLGGGDHSYDPTNFATKVRSVGAWFENYDGTGLSLTPRVYLVPVGLDMMIVPTSNKLEIRQWKVVDQKLPIPLPLTDTQMEADTYIPERDSLNGTFAAIRRFSRFRAYHDSGVMVDEEMHFDSRLVGRSVWNNRWLLIIPGETFLADPNDGLDTFIHGKKIPGSTTERDGNGVKDIKLFFQTYGYSGG
ncbi:MAG: hypothetical protein GXP31_07250 [Kiritimatiellaeota bacterium]|nr:hypothetical protein [Kiritimatiellota bacterium]